MAAPASEVNGLLAAIESGDELQSFGKAVQYRSHVIPSIAGEQVIKVGDAD